MRWILLVGLVALGGCSTTPLPKIDVSVEGPKFAESQFDCGPRPLPPDPKNLGNRGGSAAVHYETNLLTHDALCQNKLTAIGNQLRDAGQVVDAHGNDITLK